MEVITLKSISIELPDEIVELFGEAELEASLKRWTLLELVRSGKLSPGKASEILEMTRREFVVLMFSHDMPIASFSAEEIER